MYVYPMETYNTTTVEGIYMLNTKFMFVVDAGYGIFHFFLNAFHKPIRQIKILNVSNKSRKVRKKER